MTKFATTHLLMLACVGCAAVPAITAVVVQEIDCVGAQLEASDDTFEGIAAVCAPLLVTDVITIVAAKSLETSDAGTPTASALKARAVHHAVGAK
jgi:hypothetical protein